MRNYNSHVMEQPKVGWTNLYIVEKADMSVGFSNKQITLTALVAGDLVYDGFIEVRTLVTGPTGAPTAQIKVGSVAVTPTVAVKTATYAKTDNSVVGATTATGASSAVLDLQVGAGDGAAASAGEIWCWLGVNRLADRDIVA